MNNSNSANGLAAEIAGAQACSPANQILKHLKSTERDHEGNSSRLNQQLTNQIQQHIQFSSELGDPVLRVALGHLSERETSDWENAIKSLMTNLEAYRQVIGDLLPSRLLELANQQIQQRAYDEGTNSNAALDLPEFFARLNRQDSLATHFPIGIEELDHRLNGGVGGLTILLGDKGVGKTALLLNCIMTTLDDPDACVLFYSLDMTRDEILSRIWCRELRIPHRELQSSVVNDPRNAQVKEEVTSKLVRLRIIERDYAINHNHDDTFVRNGMSHLSVLKEATKLQNESRSRKLLIVVDLFQKMITPSSVVVSEVDTYRLDIFNQLTLSLRKYFQGKHFAFLVTSEMRKRDGRRSESRPTIDDIKGDGRIASDADSVLILWPTREVDAGTNLVSLDVAKGREGVLRGENNLTFHHPIGRFECNSGATRSTAASTPDTTYDE